MTYKRLSINPIGTIFYNITGTSPIFVRPGRFPMINAKPRGVAYMLKSYMFFNAIYCDAIYSYMLLSYMLL